MKRFAAPGVFWLAATVVSLSGLSAYIYAETISLFPSHIHAWTQSDRYALALCYLDNSFDLFHPCTFNLATVNGIVGVDLPIHEYVIAGIMWLTGSRDPSIFRLYTLIYSLCAYFFLFRMTFELTRSGFTSLITVLMVFTLPVVTYYQAGFVPSATSFSSSVIGLSFYWRFLRQGHYGPFYAAVAFLVLAAVPRISVSLLLLSVILHRGLVYYRDRYVDRRELYTLGGGCVLLILAFSWKQYLSEEYGTWFLNTITPAESISHFVELLSEFGHRWHDQVFTTYHYLLIAFCLLVLAVQVLRRKTSPAVNELIKLAGIVLLLTIGFFVLFIVQFVHHEYYLMDGFYQAIVLIIIAGLSTFRVRGYLWHWVWPAFLFALVIGAVDDTKRIQVEKYSLTQWDRGEVTRKNFQRGSELLDSLGVPEEAVVLVPEAYSTNAPLILLGRRGYALMDSRPGFLAEALDYNYDYIVVQDIYLASDILNVYPEFLSQVERVGGNGRISVFRRSAEGVSLYEAHGIDEPFAVDSHSFVYTQNRGWSNIRVLSLDSLDRGYPHGLIEPDVEFGPTFQIKYDGRGYDKILVEGRLAATQQEPFIIEIVGTLELHDGSKLFYQSIPVEVGSGGQWQNIAGLIVLPAREVSDPVLLKCYFWNRYGGKCLIDDIRITRYSIDD